MKLWHVAQWGNKEEGGNGLDTQCIIRSNDMMSAIAQAQIHFAVWDWRDGQSDIIILLGDDGTIGDETKIVVPVWLNPAFNLGHYPSWHRVYGTDEWADTKTMYGEG